MRGGGSQVPVAGMLGRVQIGADAPGVDRRAPDDARLPTTAVLPQGPFQDWGTLEHKALRAANHPVDDRAFEELTTGTDHQPAETRKPAAAVQGPKKPLCVLPVFNKDKEVEAARVFEP